jgi:hypothetical protein
MYRALADAIRVLAMDAVQQANSGHPGAPMGMDDDACQFKWMWFDGLRPVGRDKTHAQQIGVHKRGTKAGKCADACLRSAVL